MILGYLNISDGMDIGIEMWLLRWNRDMECDMFIEWNGIWYCDFRMMIWIGDTHLQRWE